MLKEIKRSIIVFVVSVIAFVILAFLMSMFGCQTSQIDFKRKQEYEESQSWIKKSDNGKGLKEVRIVDYDGIKKLEFYKNENCLASVSTVGELLEIGTQWKISGRCEGKVISKTEQIPPQKPFEDCFISTIKGKDILPQEPTKTQIVLKIYDKKSNPPRVETTHRWWHKEE